MIREKIILLFCFFAFSCNGCDENTGVRLLEHDYKLIVGILAPDSIRGYKQEIFYGNILDKEYKDFSNIPVCEDVELCRELFAIQNNYRGEITGNDEAEVFIENKNGERTKLTNMGNGIYRDIDNALRIISLEEYKLIINDNRKTFTAKTIVPGDFQFTNIVGGETVDVDVLPLAQGSKVYRGLFVGRTNPSIFAKGYRLDITWPSTTPPEYARFYHLYSEFEYGFGNPLVLDSNRLSMHVQTTTMQLQSIDSCYANLYAMEPGTSAGYSAFIQWMIDQNESSIKGRSNIQGPGDVAGVFGSYNKTKAVSFYMKARFPNETK